MSEQQKEPGTKKTKAGRGAIGGIDAQWASFGSTNGEEESTTGIPVSQHTSIPVKQDTSKPVSQEADLPAKQQASIPVFMKGTFYITPEHDLKLERIRLARRGRGQKIDKSALIREAIDRLQED